jgi:hypothetical protein
VTYHNNTESGTLARFKNIVLLVQFDETLVVEMVEQKCILQ